MHFAARSGREENNDNDSRKALEATYSGDYGEPTAGCSQIDEDEANGQPGEVFGR